VNYAPVEKSPRHAPEALLSKLLHPDIYATAGFKGGLVVVGLLVCGAHLKPINQQTNQRTNQSTNKPTNKPINQQTDLQPP